MWGNVGLFITPWFQNFDANSTIISKILVWVRRHNLPLHLLHPKVLEGIENMVGRYIKLDTQRIEEAISTFARICVEVELSKGLTDCILLTHNNQCWTQLLDYENITFRCRLCLQTRHLQNTCPLEKKDSMRKNKVVKKPKGWKFPTPQLNNEEEEEDLGPPITEEIQIHKHLQQTKNRTKTEERY